MTDQELALVDLMQEIGADPTSHSASKFRRVYARRVVADLFGPEAPQDCQFGPFGTLKFPYRKMGNVDTVDLFGWDELVLFAFYWANRKRYKNVLDLGANLGLHSFIMARSGFVVDAYEPDPEHFKGLQRTIAENNLEILVHPFAAAVSVERGQKPLVRVLDNLTANHLAGAKRAYGPTEVVPVNTVGFTPIINGTNLIKIDIEGHEAAVLLTTELRHWDGRDAIVEVGSVVNALAIYDHFDVLGVKIFAQKIGWQRVDHYALMPTSHKEGHIFISRADKMPWGINGA